MLFFLVLILLDWHHLASSAYTLSLFLLSSHFLTFAIMYLSDRQSNLVKELPGEEGTEAKNTWVQGLNRFFTVIREQIFLLVCSVLFLKEGVINLHVRHFVVFVYKLYFFSPKSQCTLTWESAVLCMFLFFLLSVACWSLEGWRKKK